jgi:hypothetical protein
MAWATLLLLLLPLQDLAKEEEKIRDTAHGNSADMAQHGLTTSPAAACASARNTLLILRSVGCGQSKAVHAVLCK